MRWPDIPGAHDSEGPRKEFPQSRLLAADPTLFCSRVQYDSESRRFVSCCLSRSSTLFARARSSISGNLARAIILTCDRNSRGTYQNTERTGQDAASDELDSIPYSTPRCWRGASCGASVVACRADPYGDTVDRPTDNHGAHTAPLAVLASPHAVSRTLQVHSAQPNLT